MKGCKTVLKSKANSIRKPLKESTLGYLLILPAFLIIFFMMIYPFFETFRMSFFRVSLADIRHETFVGLRNFSKIFSNDWPNFFHDILPNTFYFVGGSIILQLFLGLFLAILVNQKWLKGREIFRAIFILPWVTSAIIISISWNFMYEPRLGILNYLLRTIGISSPPNWLNDPNLAMLCIIIANVWHGTAFSFIMQTAGLQSIPENIYEASAVDGAVPWQRFIYITFPLMKPFIIINLILISMYTMNVFDMIYAMTNGGPLYKTEVVSLFMYHQAFEYGHMGLGSAIAVLILLINLLLTLLYMKLNREWAEV
ncbi:MAG: sugar ABC transporter permease [Thermotoga sp.]|nr:MAG: sugar ABC transporter permease [Thermotoga sp.]